MVMLERGRGLLWGRVWLRWWCGFWRFQVWWVVRGERVVGILRSLGHLWLYISMRERGLGKRFRDFEGDSWEIKCVKRKLETRS